MAQTFVGWPEAKVAIDRLASLGGRLPNDFQSTFTVPATEIGLPSQSVTLIKDGMAVSVFRKMDGNITGSVVADLGLASYNGMALNQRSSPDILKKTAELADYGSTLAQAWLTKQQPQSPADGVSRG